MKRAMVCQNHRTVPLFTYMYSKYYVHVVVNECMYSTYIYAHIKFSETAKFPPIASELQCTEEKNYR